MLEHLLKLYEIIEIEHLEVSRFVCSAYAVLSPSISLLLFAICCVQDLLYSLSAFALLNASILVRSHLHNLLSAGSTDEHAQCLGRPLVSWVKSAVQKVCGSAVGLMDKEEVAVFVGRAVRFSAVSSVLHHLLDHLIFESWLVVSFGCSQSRWPVCCVHFVCCARDSRVICSCSSLIGTHHPPLYHLCALFILCCFCVWREGRFCKTKRPL